MAKSIKIGTISKKQLRKADRKVSREMELENSTGWVAKNKIHKSKKKQLHRNRKHKGGEF